MNYLTRSKLSRLELSVLTLTNHYGLSVVEAMVYLPEFRGWAARAIQRLLNRLVRERLLSEVWLYAGRRCYLPTTSGLRAITEQPMLPHDQNRPLSEESKIRRFAMLSFCCLGRTRRVRLNRSAPSDSEGDPGLAISTGCYYIQPGDNVVYGFLRVDMCGKGRWDRVVAKCADDARRIRSHNHWKPHTAAGRFEITIATALPQKAERLSRALTESPAELPVRIAVIPDLLHLIAPVPS